jgi:RasGEF domain
MVGITSQCLDKLASTWQGVDRQQRLESLRALTRSANEYAAYRNAADTVETGACIPVIGRLSCLCTSTRHQSSYRYSCRHLRHIVEKPGSYAGQCYRGVTTE